MLSMAERLPPLKALRVFECAARHLSFTKAAQELHVTQAAVSHQIKALEDHLGFKLFRRLNRALLLTDAGQSYAPAIAEAFEGIHQATHRLLSQQDDSPLTVSVLPSFASTWLVPRLGAFRRAHPHIDLLIDPNPALVDLERGNVDVAIRYGLGDDPRLHHCRLMSEDLFPVCAPALLRGARALRRPEDLRRVELLHDDDHSFWRTWLAAAGIDGVDVSRGPIFMDSSMLLQAAMDGQGVAIARSVLVADALADGALARPFQLSISTRFAYFLVCLPERAMQPKIARFRDWLLSQVSATDISGVAA
jgi:LysR family glycine cleavage system transcriptional activator